MEKRIVFMFSLLLAGLFVQADAINLFKPGKKKLIECSWANCDTAFLRKNIKQMEAVTPYEGIRINVTATGTDAKGRTIKCSGRNAFSKISWRYKWFRPALDDMKNTKFTRFTDNFLLASTTPGQVGWFDDDGWKSVCNNFAILARFAKESGMKGICLDPESYNKNPLFRLKKEQLENIDNFIQQVRSRGKQFGEAIFGEYPEMKLFLFSLFENNLVAADNPRLNMHSPAKYGLYIAFLNGLYDALPPTATVLEGFGSTGYRVNRPCYYLEFKNILYTEYPNFLDKSHRKKLLTQTHICPGLYLDAYFFKGSDFWYKTISDSMDQSKRLDLLERNAAGLLQFTDEYAWTWGECGNWWSWEHKGIHKWMGEKRQKLGGGEWEKVVPGITKTLTLAHDLNAAAEDFILRRSPKNLLLNGDMEKEQKESNAIPDWRIWSNGKRGSISIEGGKGRGASSALVIHGTDGCILTQRVAAKSGQRYILVAYAKSNNSPNNASIQVDWQANGIHDCIHHSKKFAFASQPSSDNYRKLLAVVDVPMAADQIRTPMPVVGFQTDSEEVCFDDLALYLWE